MRDAKTSVPELDLDGLREQHLDDTPSQTERMLLLSRIFHAAPNQANSEADQQASSVRDWASDAPLPKKPPPKKPPPNELLPTGRLAKRRLALGLSVAAAAALVAVWTLRDPSVHPEPAISKLASATQPDDASSSPSTPRRCAIAVGNAGLLSDFEQPFVAGKLPLLLDRDQRRGRWFHVRHDPNQGEIAQPLEILPSPEGNGSRGSALRVRGEALTGWGANTGFALASCYDASAYAGLEFRARGPGGVFVAFQTLSSVPERFGGECRDKCWFNGGRHVTLTDEFETYRIRWQDVDAPSQDVAKTLLQVLFLVQSGSTYDYWLDDVSFFARGPEGK